MKQSFKAVIQRQKDLDAAYFEIPFDVEKTFGSKRVKVKATFDGTEYRGSIVNMGGCYMIGLTQALRKQIGKGPGDIVTVEVEKDTEERVVEIPGDLRNELKKSGLLLKFEKLSYTHRKEYVQWINEAKKQETRERRIVKTIESINKL